MDDDWCYDGLVYLPFWEYWNPHPGNKCISEIGKLLSAAITNVITDLIILLLPIPTFWTLRLPPREKITLIVLMSLGEGYNVWLWSDIEINLAVVSPSVPVLRPFAQKYLPLLGFKSLYQPSEGTPADYRNRKVVYRQDTIQQIIGDTYDDDSSTKALDLAPSLIAMTSSKRSRGFSNDRP
ncbi:hypothetical protein PRK78_006314 [Emydomyces testavorans]|uniref:Rhodopsin domain-containing protein n=1 Tax=Emydomyces testavorans TaxID=2070801 RepID=A0AAF0DL46_9EURO|nr:hypothetical protein PRK78_006314 [Emydomyces testavorans]